MTATAQAPSNQQSETWTDSVFTRRNLKMFAIILMVFAVSVLIVNRTYNETLSIEAAEDIPDDVEDIGQDVFDTMITIAEGTQSLASADLLDDASTTLPTALADTFDEDAAQLIERLGVQMAGTAAVVVAPGDLSNAEVETSDAAVIDADIPESPTWTTTEEGARYLVPLDDGQGLAWADVSVETLNALMTEGAEGEDLFADTQNGYVLLLDADNNVVTAYNRDQTEGASELLGQLTEDTLNTEEGYYRLGSDAVNGESSVVATHPYEDAGWQAVGSFPTSEVPSATLTESLANLFEFSEIGEIVSSGVESVVNFLNEDIGWLFRGMRWPIEQVILGLENLLLALPWYVVILATGAVAWAAGGRDVAYIGIFGMFAIGLLGLWDLTMTTLAMLLTSMAFCVAVGIPVGIWAARNDRVNEIVRGVLDAMQTIHPFVYLVPIVVLFGIGKVPGTIATIIFALPPMVRLTNLGIRQVPEDVVEASRSFGSSDWQLLRDVQIPLALPSIMAGVNQTLMLSLSMVVIVALIAGGGLGQEIYRAIGRADTGRAVVAGVAVLLLAVVIDRISQGGTKPREREVGNE